MLNILNITRFSVKTAITSCIIILCLVLLFNFNRALSIQLFPLIMLPIVALGWLWGIKKGRIAEERREQRAESMRKMQEKKSTEGKASWDEHLLRVITNSSPLGMLAISNNEDDILYCNHRFCEIFDVEDHEEKILSGDLTNTGLIALCTKMVRDEKAYHEIFRSAFNFSAGKTTWTNIQFKDGRIIKHLTSQIRDENKECLGRLFTFEDITESRTYEDLLKKRYAYEHLLYEISNQFINVSPEGIDAVFTSSLRRISEFLDMDSGYFYQVDHEKGIASNLFEWQSNNCLSKINSLEVEFWPSFKERLINFEKVLIPDVEAMPGNSSQEKEFLRKRGVRSIIISPVVSGKRLSGFIGFSSSISKELPDDADAMLNLTGDIFANALMLKQKNEALLASEERSRLLLQHSTDMIGILDMDGYVTYVSPASKSITGKEPNEWLGKLLYSNIHPEDAVKVRNIVREFIENPTLPPVKLSLRLPVNGNEMIVLESIFNGQLNNPSIKGIVCNSRDMSQHVALQEALRNSRNFLNAIIDNAGDPLFVKDSSHRYTMVNEAFCRLSGLCKEQILGRTDFDLAPEELARDYFAKDEYLLVNGGMEIFELEFFDRQGNKHFLITNETLYMDEKGEKYIIASIRDETKRKELEQEVNNALMKERELNRLKSKFISMVSHEYRTPLTAILSSAELLELFGNEMTKPERLGHLEKIKSSVDFLISMLNEVLLLNKAESMRMEYNPSAFDLIAFSRELMKNLGGNSYCNIELDADFNSRRVVMDKKLLGHILTNLLSNALKYSPEGGSVLFIIRCGNGLVSFEIRDNGLGIPQEEQPRLFEPFFRANNVLHIAGSGLGLSIVKHCVELHKGEILFESKPGEGTKFMLRLPDESEA
ncbi:MAG: PAS domain S-box protein [Ignavibacteria bacterium]|nr:PAS domain S-box protein [Ignavibacteria bacterium]MCU7504909.1 PAS domain S-box protein [Ignavibacteria bacterium]MCU7517799.1 PAS domain S-box protein [Ignavibacteria bacterium]